MTQKIDAILIAKEAVAGGAELLRQHAPPSVIGEIISKTLADGRTFVLWPSRKSMRLFFTLSGFIKAIESATQDLKDKIEVVVPAGLYANELIYVIRPKTSF